jgi:hypothetical protein
VLDRLEPAARDLVTHIEQSSDYRAPVVSKQGPNVAAPEAAP